MEPTTNPAPVMEPKVTPTYTMNTAPVQTPPPMTPPPFVPPPVRTVPPVVPPTPPAAPTPSGDHREVRVILPALLLVLILGALYYWYANRAPKAPYTPSTATSTAQSSSSTTPFELASAKPTSLPAGFPAGIPVEKDNLTEAYKIDYKQYNVTQYTASYTSTKSKEALWVLFQNYVSANGFTMNTKVTNKAQGVFDAIKGKDEINVVITTRAPGSYVQITYVKR